MLSDVLINAGVRKSVPEKTWTIITIRAPTRIGWVKLVARCASDLMCILKKAPIVSPGRSIPTVPAVLSINQVRSSRASAALSPSFSQDNIHGLHLARQPDVPVAKRGGHRPVIRHAATVAVCAQRRATAKQGRWHVGPASSVPHAQPDPVIKMHKAGITYVVLGQTHKREIFRNNHGSQA